MSRRLVYRAIYVPCLLALAALVVMFAHPARSRATSTHLKTFAAEDKSFRIDYPSNWRVLASNQNGTGTYVRFQRDENAEVAVTCDLTGSLLLDMSRTGSSLPASLPGVDGSMLPPNGAQSGAEVPVQKTPVQSAHEAGAGALKGKFSHYAEQAARPSQIAGSQALTSAFTGQTRDVFNSHEVVGRRVTVVVGNRPVTLDAFCPKGDEADFFATFNAMLKTLVVSENGG